MALETGAYICDLNVANPVAGDPKSQGDDHLRLIKACLKAQFPSEGTFKDWRAGAVATGVEDYAYKSRGTVAAPSVITTGDFLKKELIYGYDGTQFVNAGAIYWQANGTIAANSVSASWGLWLHPDSTSALGLVLQADFNGVHANNFDANFDGGSFNGVTARDTVDAASAWFLICRNSAQTVIGGVQRNVSSNAVLFQTSSDYRMKENVVSLTNAGARVKALNPVTFEWRGTDGQVDEGFLAHELQTVVPVAVTGQKDAVTTDGAPKYQSVDYSKVVPVLAAALKEALELIDELQVRVTALEAKEI